MALKRVIFLHKFNETLCFLQTKLFINTPTACLFNPDIS